ncbi:hypothetical protein VHEMI03157 [[Torrubiella] hemipterigena]|uniref:Uncharacterized protein n=1 Tax=[Torrubiella] hemipterigena TaxID=1531966 RepID=A0A0A1SRV6_9HYPO|nr:hypothetical protein VHEMI03157 [[Torrubiella] hemipterigena]
MPDEHQPAHELSAAAAAPPAAAPSPVSSAAAHSTPSAQVSPEAARAAIVPPPATQAEQYQNQAHVVPEQPTAELDSENGHVANKQAPADYYPAEPNSWKWAKLTLYTLCALLAIGTLGCAAYMKAVPARFYIRDSMNGLSVFAICLSIFTLVFIGLELAFRYIPGIKQANGLNPTVGTAGWFLIWSSMACIAGFWGFHFGDLGYYVLFDDYLDYHETAKGRFRAEFAGLIFSGILTILSFVIWVRCCEEANRRNGTVVPATSGAAQERSSVLKSGWGLYKLGLNVAAFVLCVLGAGLSLGFWSASPYRGDSDMPYYSRNFYGEYSDPMAWVSIVFFIAMIWIIADFITLAARKLKGAIHPGAHVGVWLIVWIAMIIVCSFTFVVASWPVDVCGDNTTGRGGSSSGSSSSGSSSYGSSSSGDDDYTNRYYYDDECATRTQLSLASGIAAVSFLVYALVTFLFFTACADTHIRNTNKVVPVVYVPVVPQQQALQPVQLANGQTAMAMVYPTPPQPMYQQHPQQPYMQPQQQQAYMQPAHAPQPSGSGSQQAGQVKEYYGTAH